MRKTPPEEMLHSLLLRTPKFRPVSSHLRSSIQKPSSNSLPPSPHPPFLLRFRTAYREKIHYLKNLGIIDSNLRNPNPPSHEDMDQILSIINYLKSQGFSDSEIPRLASSCPNLFTSNLDPSDISPVFEFLTVDLSATIEESRGLILFCPQILFSNVDYCLRPTLMYLKDIGLERLNLPTNLNAHLLNTRVSKLEVKMEFLQSIGFEYDEAKKACTRLPPMFGYSIENNLRPKFEYLVGEMRRSIEELKVFPQYFAFSLKKRIVPRHLHLKQRGLSVSLKRMLLWGDQKFYAKWK
ncbi:hypothetical protein Ancab_027445 [Ancistrocladus abbreviatus]